MNIKKIGGSLAVAIVMLSLSAFAQAEECSVVAQDIEDEAFTYGCDYGEYVFLVTNEDGTTRTGDWRWDSIWQFKGTRGDGCKVHLGLISQLYVPHGSPPKGKGSSKNNGYRDAQGAANALRDNKPEDALHHLQNVIDTIDNSAKLNLELKRKVYIGPVLTEVRADYFAGLLREFAEAAKLRIYNPDNGYRCSAP